MLPEIMGYRRPDGRFGIRNHIAVIATMDNANPTVRRICSLVKGCVPFCPGFGRGEMNEDLALHNLLSINTALHPNVYGVIVVALEDQTAEYITGEIAKGGKPVVGFSIEDQAAPWKWRTAPPRLPFRCFTMQAACALNPCLGASSSSAWNAAVPMVLPASFPIP